MPGPVDGVRYEKPAIAPKLCVFAARDHCPPRSNRTFIRVEYVGKIAEIVACHGDHAVILGYLRPAPILAASHIVVAAQKEGLPVYSRPGPRCFDRCHGTRSGVRIAVGIEDDRNSGFTKAAQAGHCTRNRLRDPGTVIGPLCPFVGIERLTRQCLPVFIACIKEHRLVDVEHGCKWFGCAVGLDAGRRSDPASRPVWQTHGNRLWSLSLADHGDRIIGDLAPGLDRRRCSFARTVEPAHGVRRRFLVPRRRGASDRARIHGRATG